MRKIAIIGAGISGLSVLHYLKKYLGEAADVTLYEREEAVGGTIRSIKKGSGLFEWGPNGFLDNQPVSLELTDDLGISDRLIEADPSANRRYIQIQGKLTALPSGPLSFIRSPIVPMKDKWALLCGLFKKRVSTDCSIHDYISRRFSPNIAEALVDPFISGIYAGDIRRLHMASAFPKFKGKGGKRSRMRSFKNGMGDIIDALNQRYRQYIKTNSEVTLSQIEANITIVAAPAYAASRIIINSSPALARLLDQMPYAPVAVAGLLFNRDSFKHKPDGFGYLIPSREQKDVLGVLVESNVYINRADDSQVLLRVMMGGAHHPAMINDSPQQILDRAVKEIDDTYGLLSNPVDTVVKQWPKAIPQYEVNYPQWRKAVTEECARTPGLYLCANYLDGISFNDCIRNAQALARLLSS